MFHSFGTIQSNTGVPEETVFVSSGISRAIRSSVRRTPSPVMLRQIGNSSDMSARTSSATSVPAALLALIPMIALIVVGEMAIALGNDFHSRRPDDIERRVVPTHAALRGRYVRVGCLIVHFGVVLQRDVTVRDTSRDVEHSMIFRR